MNWVLHAWQQSTLEYAISRIRQMRRYTLITAPTGTGKSMIIIKLQKENPLSEGTWVLTPRIEIIRGILKKLGYTSDLYSESQILDVAFERRISTPIRFKNAILAGRISGIKCLIIDEVHHHNADTYQLIDQITEVPVVGFTATGFRGNAKETLKFRETWGPAYAGITYVEAVRQRFIQMPHCQIEALIDDDVVNIVNGEFEITALESVTRTRLEDVIGLIDTYWSPSANKVDIATMISVPSVRIANQIQNFLTDKKIMSRVISQESSDADRQLSFKLCCDSRAFLLQIEVVSEGVDLPIRRLIDLKPTMSPVRWLQQIGRIMRPGDTVPEYICTNRNLLRHGYLLEGLIPTSKYVEAEGAFPDKRSRYLGYRAIGLEALGRFKPTVVKMENGLNAVLYNLTTTNGHQIEQYAIILHPMISEPLCAKKSNRKDSSGEIQWGKWQACDPPNDLKGFQSAIPKTISTKQKEWWDKSARAFGLDATTIPDAKQFQILPILSDLRKKVV